MSEPHQLPDGMEGDLRVIGARLYGQVAASARFYQLVAIEAGQVD
jgi:hypothetical protein